MPITIRTAQGVVVDGSTPIRNVPTAQTLHLARGTDGLIRVTIVNSAGAPVDLTSCACTLSIKQNPDDAVPLIARLGDVVSPYTAGVVEFALGANDTIAIGEGTFFYDVVVVFGDSLRAQVIPISNFVVDASAGSSTLLPTVPIPALVSGKVLGNDGTHLEWVENGDAALGGMTLANDLQLIGGSTTAALDTAKAGVLSTDGANVIDLPDCTTVPGQSFIFFSPGGTTLRLHCAAGDQINGGGDLTIGAAPESIRGAGGLFRASPGGAPGNGQWLPVAFLQPPITSLDVEPANTLQAGLAAIEVVYPFTAPHAGVFTITVAEEVQVHEVITQRYNTDGAPGDTVQVTTPTGGEGTEVMDLNVPVWTIVRNQKFIGGGVVPAGQVITITASGGTVLAAGFIRCTRHA